MRYLGHVADRRPKTKEQIALRRRVAAYLRKEWDKFLSQEPNGLQRQFADLLKLHEGTVSKILRGDVDSASLDVLLALEQRGVACEYLLKHDPDKRFFEPLKIDGRARRHSAPVLPAVGRKRGHTG